MKITENITLALEQEINDLIYEQHVLDDRAFVRLIERLEELATNFSLIDLTIDFKILDKDGAALTEEDKKNTSLEGITFVYWQHLFYEDVDVIVTIIKSAFKQRAQDLRTLSNNNGFNIYRTLRQQSQENRARATDTHPGTDYTSSRNLFNQRINSTCIGMLTKLDFTAYIKKIAALICRRDIQDLLKEGAIIAAKRGVQQSGVSNNVSNLAEDLFVIYIGQLYTNICTHIYAKPIPLPGEYENYGSFQAAVFEFINKSLLELDNRVNEIMVNEYYIFLIKNNASLLFDLVASDQLRATCGIIKYKSKEDIKELFPLLRLQNDIEQISSCDEQTITRVIAVLRNADIMLLYNKSILTLSQILECTEVDLIRLARLFSDAELHSVASLAVEEIIRRPKNPSMLISEKEDRRTASEKLDHFEQAMKLADVKLFFVRNCFTADIILNNSIDSLRKAAEAYFYPKVFPLIERGWLYIPQDLNISSHEITGYVALLLIFQEQLQHIAEKRVVDVIKMKDKIWLLRAAPPLLKLMLVLLNDAKLLVLLEDKFLDSEDIYDFILNNMCAGDHFIKDCAGDSLMPRTLALFHCLYDFVYVNQLQLILGKGPRGDCYKLLEAMALYSEDEVMQWLAQLLCVIERKKESIKVLFYVMFGEKPKQSYQEKLKNKDKLNEAVIALSNPLISSCLDSVKFKRYITIYQKELALYPNHCKYASPLNFLVGIYRLTQFNDLGNFFKTGLLTTADVFEDPWPAHVFGPRGYCRLHCMAYSRYLKNTLSEIDLHISRLISVQFMFFGMRYPNIMALKEKLLMILQDTKSVENIFKDPYHYFEEIPQEIKHLEKALSELIELFKDRGLFGSLSWSEYCHEQAESLLLLLGRDLGGIQAHMAKTEKRQLIACGKMIIELSSDTRNFNYVKLLPTEVRDMTLNCLASDAGLDFKTYTTACRR